MSIDCSIQVTADFSHIVITRLSWLFSDCYRMLSTSTASGNNIVDLWNRSQLEQALERLSGVRLRETTCKSSVSESVQRDWAPSGFARRELHDCDGAAHDSGASCAGFHLCTADVCLEAQPPDVAI